jgi:hypothetical protein
MNPQDPSSLSATEVYPFGKDLQVIREFNKARKEREKEEKQFLVTNAIKCLFLSLT